jgi:hypothetical protein
LFQQAGEDGGAAYGDAFNDKVDEAVGKSQETLTSQFQAERAVLAKLAKEAQETAIAMITEEPFYQHIEFVGEYGEVVAPEGSGHFMNVEERVAALKEQTGGFASAYELAQSYGKQLQELDKQFKFDIALTKELGDQTKKTAENYDGTTKSVQELTEEEERRAEKRKKKREEEKKAEEARQKALDDLLNKEVERNLTEEQLLKKRLDDKLKELGLDKDITKLTDKELQARTALEQKYADDIDDIQDQQHLKALQRIKELNDARIKGVTESSSIEVLALKTAHLNKMRQLQTSGS